MNDDKFKIRFPDFPDWLTDVAPMPANASDQPVAAVADSLPEK